MNCRLACLLLCASLAARAELVSGVVKQLHGLPAVGAVVELRPTASPAAPLSARTDGEGRFAVGAPPGTYALRVAGALDDTRHALTVVAGEPPRLALGVDWPWSRPPVAHGSLTVLNVDGQPVPDAAVRLVAQGELEPVPPECIGMAQRTAADGLGTHARCWVYQRALTSDARGRCAFEVPAGLVTLGAFDGRDA